MKTKFLLLFFTIFTTLTFAQEKDKSPWADDNFSGLKLRSIGPAFMSGRIADIAIHPSDDNIWYVAVGSGGVWKTVNAGVTWTPIFDNQPVYSIGCITIDPNNPHTIWVGTGENVGGRHVGFGDGIYRSTDGGATWKNMGLKESEHISEIIIHPTNSDIIWVAAQGPLWSKGGQRGLYKTIDGGQNWKLVLGDDEWVGVTDIALDPRNPDQIYAATWQRHRTVAAYMGGGPGTGIHRSSDGGETWEKVNAGLPTSNMGKIGIAISPQKPDVLYAAIELDRRTGAVYRSTDRGASWTKGAPVVAGGTGPHYYQELYACPHQFDRIYLMDVRVQVSDDGGKSFRRIKEEHKHSDNHALVFRQDDPDYLLMGTDGGLYESFDLAENWRFIDNLPVTQFYKVAVDDTEPFYNVFGGTQDNSTEGGPSRTDNLHGIQNSDWRVILNWDGHQPATEPGNPNIMYAERQEGTLSRIDMITGEVIDIRPQPAADEPYERFNWDAPILVSPHDPKRIYFASQRVWRSDNRGDAWQSISSDLTRDQERLSLPIMGQTQSWDNAWDVLAMSNYNTITSLAESPLQEGLLYAGTDDGLVQITEDGGQNWRQVEVSSISGVPKTAFVNDIKADLADANTVYMALDNHKYGDYKPYLVKSTDKGKTWRSITSNLPDKLLVWRLVQDHVQTDLLFIGTEFGIYFSVNGGQCWTKLKGGVPTISFRDLAIHRRENDLIGASFGRGFYIFDDISVLRELSDNQLDEEATLFSTRKAWWYIPRSDLSFYGQKGSQGAAHFVAPNPDFGAVLTYYLKDDLKSKKALRQATEKENAKNKQNNQFPGWDAIAEEENADEAKIWLTIKNQAGEVIRRLSGKTQKGFHRIAWDLRYPSPYAMRLEGTGGASSGLMAAPGTYTATLSKEVDGIVTPLSKPQSFEVVPLRAGALKGASHTDVAAFWRAYEDAVRNNSAMQIALGNTIKRANRMHQALHNSTADVGTIDQALAQVQQNLKQLSADFYGETAKNQIGEKTKPTIGNRLFSLNIGIGNSTYGPTKTHLATMQILNTEMADIKQRIQQNQSELVRIGKQLMEAGAPWLEGMALPE